MRDRPRIEPDYAHVDVDERTWLRRDLVRWGPIVAGLATVLATMLVLTVLGTAIGLSAFEPDADGSTYTTAAAIWGGVSALVAFFLGGWIAARSAAVGGMGAGGLNGILVGVAALALTVWLVGSGVGNLLGAAATNVGEIASVSFSADPQSAFDEAETGAWATFITLVLALGAAFVGGLVGHRPEVDDR